MLSKVDRAKELLSDEKQRIALHDLFAAETRALISATSDKEFPLSGSWTPTEEFAERIQRYNLASHDLIELVAVACYWAQDFHAETIRLPICRYAGTAKSFGGLSDLSWYPIQLMIYHGGIAAIAAENYQSFANLLSAKVPGRIGGPQQVVVALPKVFRDMKDFFKSLPGHDKQYTPMSEYLYKHIQPSLDDICFLGNEYESFFDRFEIFYALEHASRTGSYWGPPGRFGWKYYLDNPEMIEDLIAESVRDGDSWPPLKAGLFGGTHAAFVAVANRFKTGLLDRLGWH